MKRLVILMLVSLLVLPVFAVTMTSCGGKDVKKQVGLTDEEKARLEAERRRREEEERRRAAEAKALAEQQKARFLTEHALFDFDKYNVRPDAAEVLRFKAQYMTALPNVTVEIQGHCDARGTRVYNMALGDRRAKSAKAFVESMGVAGSRMTTRSFGKDKPLDPGRGEGAWSKNRRAEFHILSE